MNWAVLVAFLGGLSGSIITLVGSVINTKLNHKHELKKAKQSQIIELGYKDFERKKLAVEKLIEQGQGVKPLTLEMHLFFHRKYMEFLDKEDISREEIKQFLFEMEQYKFEFEQHYQLYGTD
jgi:hypothetical protein